MESVVDIAWTGAYTGYCMDRSLCWTVPDTVQWEPVLDIVWTTACAELYWKLCGLAPVLHGAGHCVEGAYAGL